ncbi:hypothetical protein B5V88_15105 [Heyndrickxia sporothermodurans]|uniref:Uncharacterized protein n=1 Tax=Heyndrickxia sporothermodurans TaxID=46224 RepID=A0AB37HJ82_9BACI|nr:hypothetical protein [Heyndrickxia sporothermodurans]MBL5769276.1 hypothetical protein [Heyndrickxia sporothermodurans]MBL5772504.1 hypothetical protein [Heyndrickxia sporothermodurans]MBL5776024.1 hypothetical protein [Heyndrickxia sporothermodurans]MBL5779566.1 hypothetical protein [Heyndrickxia sporothermodurans]MBL5783110.1 hypothetical protein [Heyndrickxia sporothermodurans]
MTTKFRPSIVHYSSVKDIQMVIEELLEEIDEKVFACEQYQKKYQSEGCHPLADQFHGKIVGYLEMKSHLQEKLSEVRGRYRN